jgi:hypothetical protein
MATPGQAHSRHVEKANAYQLLRGQPVREVARKLGVTAARVSFAKYRISRLLKREIQRLNDALR